MRVEERKFNNPISPYDVRDYKFACVSETTLPETYDCLAKTTIAVKDQGTTSSCVAHACSSVIEYHNKKQQATDILFSTEFIYGYRPFGYYVGEGMYIRDALKTMQKLGDVPLVKLRGNHEYAEAMEVVDAHIENLKDIAYPNRISTYMRVNSTVDIKQALIKYGPVLVSMPWHVDYKLVDGVYTYTKKDTRGNHCVVVYGWNEKGWLVHNSWGRNWGRTGRFIVPFDFKWNEAWSVADNITDPNIIRPQENWFVRTFAKAINAVANFFRKLFKRI